jgi:glycosyltransferase involved in cell wall biosynthesis
VSDRTPRVSVVVPVYNGERYIAATLASVLEQEGVDLEVIVSDNASTDATADIVACLDDPRIRYARNDTNLGAVPNWNIGMERVRGEYVKLLCADDLVYPGSLARQVSVLDENPDVVITCGPHDVIDENGEHVLMRGFKHRGRMAGAEAIRRMARTGTNLVGEPSNVLIRAEACHAAGPWDEASRYVVDQEMWMRLLLLGDLFVTEGPLSAFRVQRGSWSNQLAGNQTGDVRALLHKLAADPRYGVSGLDVALGTIGAWRNTQMRRAFYAVYLRPEASE